jgi:conjugative relaxase-like TrwC/TraI family protein
MLNVGEQKSAEGAKAYFVKSDYLSEGQELVGEWSGEGAKLLGLHGEVQKEDFDRLCDNLHPKTGEQFTPVTRSGRRVGYDLTWSAPKSISAVHALTGDEDILKAFKDSIHETMRDMEKELCTRVRKGGEDHDRVTGNWITAEFVHLTSRPVDGVPCPQLHMHAFTFNATYDAIEEQWKAGQFGPVKRDGYYWQAVQQARFANKLQQAGYSVRRTNDAFEIDGIPQSVLDKFSQRRKVIEEAAERLGIKTPQGWAKLGATTREAKNHRHTYEELKDIWRKRMDPAEQGAIDQVLADKTPHKPIMRNVVHAQFAVEHSFERSSVIEERRLHALALRHGCGEVTPEGIKAEADRNGLLKRIQDGRTWVTTKEVLKEESRMIDFAVQGKATMRPLGLRPIAISSEANTAALSREQQAVIRHVMTSQDRVMMVRGAAGTGKSTLTKAAAKAIEAAGKHVVMVAPTTDAVKVLKRDGLEASTVADLLVNPKTFEQAKDGVIWVDEASLVGTKTMAALFDKAKEQNARVVLMGDKQQMGSIERGSALHVLEAIAKLPVAELSGIRRQSGEYKQAVKLLAKGKALEGFDMLDSMGWVKTLEGYDEVAKLYAEKIRFAKKPEDAAVIICPTHKEGRLITEAVREELKERRVITGEEHEVRQLSNTQWTEAQRGDPQQYTGEELLVVTRRGGGHEAGDEIRAGSVDLSTLKPSRFSTYNERSIHVSRGDMIRVTGAGKTKDKDHRLTNGAVYRIRDFTKDGDMILDNGWTISKDFGHITHAYVNTYFTAQGRTTDHAIVVHGQSSLPAVSQNGLYVAASRGRKSCTIFTDARDELRDAIETERKKLSATELVGRPKPQLVKRIKWAAERARNALIKAKHVIYETITPQQERQYVFER